MKPKIDNNAKLTLSADGSRVTKITLNLHVVGLRGVLRAAETVIIDLDNGTVKGHVVDSSDVSLGEVNACITVDDADKIPTVSLKKQVKVKRIFDHANIANAEKLVEVICAKDTKSDKTKVRRDVLSKQVRQDVARRLLELREKRRFTQPQMVDEFSLTAPDSTGYSRWENGGGRITLTFLRQLAEKWNVDLNWLVLGTPMDTPSLTDDVRNAIKVLEELRRSCDNRK